MNLSHTFTEFPSNLPNIQRFLPWSAQTQLFHGFQDIIRDFSTSIADRLLKSYSIFHHYTHFCLISLQFFRQLESLDWAWELLLLSSTSDRPHQPRLWPEPLLRLTHMPSKSHTLWYPDVCRTMVTQTVLMILEEPRKAPWNSPSISELLWETVDAVSILAVGFLAKLHILHSFSYLLNKKPGIKKSFLSPRHLSPILLWLGSLWNPDVLLCVTDQSNANPKTQRLHITVPSVSEDSESTFSFFKVWWKFLPWCWEALGSDCFCFRLRAVLYEKSVSLMCFDLLSVTCLTPTCGCLHLSDQKRSYIWMGVVEISTHSGGSQQEALNTKIFSSTQQRPLGSTHIASLPALVSSRSANNTVLPK